jgi:hypothetical protein
MNWLRAAKLLRRLAGASTNNEVLAAAAALNTLDPGLHTLAALIEQQHRAVRRHKREPQWHRRAAWRAGWTACQSSPRRNGDTMHKLWKASGLRRQKWDDWRKGWWDYIEANGYDPETKRELDEFRKTLWREHAATTASGLRKR